MIDLLHLPEPDERTVWFPGQGASTNTTGWRVWTKPRGISMVSILAIGSGGGGGGGAVANNSGGVVSAAYGGAGGAGAPMAKMLFPAWMLPDKLYVLSVSGGLGGSGAPPILGAAGNTGGTGAPSIVAVYPNAAVSGNFILTTLVGGRGGAGGSVTSGGGANSLGGPSATSAPLGQMAATQLFISGTASTAGSNTTPSGLSPEIICRGAPGGGHNASSGAGDGGGYQAVVGTLLNAVAGANRNTSANASSGFIHAGFHYGGCGGGGSRTSGPFPGGRGGNGVAWGAGGGGGGATDVPAFGSPSVPGGRGGDGGPGLVIIASW